MQARIIKRLHRAARFAYLPLAGSMSSDKKGGAKPTLSLSDEVARLNLSHGVGRVLSSCRTDGPAHPPDHGLLLDDDWCAFFKAHDVLVGLSVDVPRELHDTYRLDRRGHGTFDLLMTQSAIRKDTNFLHAC